MVQMNGGVPDLKRAFKGHWFDTKRAH